MPGSAAEWAVYALMGASVGALALFGVTGIRRVRTARRPASLRWPLATLIAGGEQERVEFKASARWDHKDGRLNRALEHAVARTVAGFLNEGGGTALIGIADDRQVVGLAADYRTLRRPSPDGFAQFLIGLIEARLGGDVCPLVHITFGGVAGRDVCRIDVEASDHPVYLRDGDRARYFVRAGNTTRELDVPEAIAHIRRRAGAAS